MQQTITSITMLLGGRAAQQDCLLVHDQIIQSESFTQTLAPRSGPQIFAVCDGMGSPSIGGAASRLVCEGLMRWFGKLKPGLPDRQRLAEFLRKLHEYSLGPLAENTGTTLAGLLLDQGQAMAFNAGDSRVYRLNAAGMVRLSYDHSLVQQIIAKGFLSEEEAFGHPHKNVLTFGLGPAFKADWERETPHVAVSEAAPGDFFLLCSDGLWEYYRDQELYQMLWPDPMANVQRLREVVEEHGPRDNTSFLLVQVVP